MSIKNELQAIISGNGEVRHGRAIQAVAGQLEGEKGAVLSTQRKEFSKKEEETVIADFSDLNDFWYQSLDINKYIGEGAEQRVFEDEDPRFVLKFNDGIFYLSWIDYLRGLLLHNYFFPHLAYELLGFSMNNDKMYAVVRQPYVQTQEITDLHTVRSFLLANGFELIKNNDYINHHLGIILEDLHDENVLTKNGGLYFIDTVFYLLPDFFNNDSALQ